HPVSLSGRSQLQEPDGPYRSVGVDNPAMSLEDHVITLPRLTPDLAAISKNPAQPFPVFVGTMETELPGMNEKRNGGNTAYVGARGEEKDPEEEEDGIACGCFWRFRSSIAESYQTNQRYIRMVLVTLLCGGYNAYLVAAIWHNREKGLSWDFCNGLGFLLVVTGLLYFGLFYFLILKPLWLRFGPMERVRKITEAIHDRPVFRYAPFGGHFGFGLAVAVFLIVDTKEDRRRLISIIGIFFLVLFGFLFSKHPDKIKWRQVFWGLGLQFVFGLVILRWEVGNQVLQCVADKVTAFLGFTDAGSSFVFGYLVDGDPNPALKFSPVFAFKVLSVIFFFGFVTQILYYYGVIQWIVVKLGWVLHVTMGTTAAESMNAAANIFIGMVKNHTFTEAPLIIKPYLNDMTKSELHAVMTGGFATIAGGVFAAYLSFGVKGLHLLTASVMSAPAALACSKLLYPETRVSKTTAKNIKIEKGTEVNALDAAAHGANSVIMLVANIVANLIAMLAFVAFLNAVIAWFAALVDLQGITFEYLISLPLIPVAWVMGVEWSQCHHVAELIGIKTVLNEFVGYQRLQEMQKASILSERSEIIATYALCGFANLGSIGILMGALSGLIPERRSEISKLVVRAMIAGNMACLLTACVAGTLLTTS
ncbi:unnamed protein product, partial [Darwinula stevensoni]